MRTGEDLTGQGGRSSYKEMSQEVGEEGLGAPWKGARVDKGAQEKFCFSR